MIVSTLDQAKLVEELTGSACAFGVFDGVHEGHRFIIDTMLKAAKDHGLSSVVLTFDRDPDELFCGETLRKLMDNETRLAVLEATGVDYVVALPFTPEFAALEPQAFMDLAFGAGAPAQLFIGEDFRFGSHAAGDAHQLATWGNAHNMQVNPLPLFQLGGEVVTATAIRKHLAACDIKRANALLGSAYGFRGTVEAGRGEGRDTGFRTANLSVPAQVYALGEGVYAAYAFTGGKRYKAAVSVGGAPTFGEAAHHNVEVHILDFQEDIYGQELRLEFVEFLRPMMVFPSLEVLIETVMGNIQWCRDNL